MINTNGYESYLRRKFSLERKLEEVKDSGESKEIENQLHLIESRLLSRIKQAHSDAGQEMDTLRSILSKVTRQDESST